MFTIHVVQKIQIWQVDSATSVPKALVQSLAHPGQIVFSMAFRLLRIVKSQELFEQRLKELKSDYMIPRDYKDSVIKMLLKK